MSNHRSRACIRSQLPNLNKANLRVRQGNKLITKRTRSHRIGSATTVCRFHKEVLIDNSTIVCERECADIAQGAGTASAVGSPKIFARRRQGDLISPVQRRVVTGRGKKGVRHVGECRYTRRGVVRVHRDLAATLQKYVNVRAIRVDRYMPRIRTLRGPLELAHKSNLARGRVNTVRPQLIARIVGREQKLGPRADGGAVNGRVFVIGVVLDRFDEGARVLIDGHDGATAGVLAVVAAVDGVGGLGVGDLEDGASCAVASCGDPGCFCGCGSVGAVGEGVA